VGWGVQGKFGSNEQDDGSHILKRHAVGKNKMVRNDKGLWVKVSESADSQPSQVPSKLMSKVPSSAPSQQQSNDKSRSPDTSRYKDKRRSPSTSSSSGSSSGSESEQELCFTAAQLAEHMCELFVSVTSKKVKSQRALDMLSLCLHDDLKVLPLSRQPTEGVWPESSQSFVAQWQLLQTLTTAQMSPKTRIYVQVPQRKDLASFCVDVFPTNNAPGFSPSGVCGDGGAVVVVYRAVDGKITHIWCGDDMGVSERAMTEEQFLDSELFVGNILEVMFESFGARNLEDMVIHFNDYTDIPVAG